MLVYICYLYYGHGQHSAPEAVFESEKEAIQWTEGREDSDYIEMEVE